MILLDVFFCATILIFGFKLKDNYAFSLEEKKLLNKIFFFHILICCIATPIIFKGGDAKFYWMGTKDMSFEEIWAFVLTDGRATSIMLLINYFFSNILALSFFSGMILYSFIGYWGFIYLVLIFKHILPNYLLLKNVKIFNIPIVPLLFFLPNMHFWSVAIGKDTLCFFAIILFVYSFLSINKRIFMFVLSCTIMFFLRSHILLFGLTSFGLALLLKGKIQTYKKIIISILFSILFAPVLNAVLETTKMEQLDIDSIEKFNDTKSTALLKAGSAVDISSYPYPLKVFTFLFRPLFFDAFNFLSLISSLENIVLLVLFIRFLKDNFYSLVFKTNNIVLGSFLFYFIGAVAFAPVLSNLGIMIREKNMLTPCFLIFVMTSQYQKKIRPYIKVK